MLSIGVLQKRSWDYLVREDYYAKEQARPGFWFGRGAEEQGLVGHVDPRAYERLSLGFGADGSKHAQNAGVRDEEGLPVHHPGWDLTFSAPKSVSVYWSLSDAETRHRIEQALIEAAKDALRDLEKNSIYTRLGRGGAIREKAKGLTAAGFLHTTSRAGEPQLHVHFAVFNEVLCQDGKWRTMYGISSKRGEPDFTRSRLPFFGDKMSSGALFRASLASRLEKDLGLRTRRQGDSFELEGVPRELCQLFSSRRRQIVDEMHRQGETSPKAAEKIARQTRSPKTHISMEELFSRWRALARGFDLSRLRKEEVARNLTKEVRETEHATRERLAQARHKPSRAQAVRTMAEEAQGRGVDADTVLLSAERIFREKSRRSAHDRGPNDRERSDRTTARGRAAESSSFASRDRAAEKALRFLEKVLRRSRSSRRHVVGAANVLLARKQAEFLSGRKFTEPERVELSRVTRERGSIQVLSASDEQARLTTLLAARFAWERAGMRVLGASPLWETARLCDEKTGIHFITLEGLTRGLRTWRGPIRGYDSALKNSLRHGLGGFPSTKAFLKYVIKASGKWIRLDEKTVLVLDNPRAISLSDFADLVRRVHKARAKLVVLDDQPASRVRGEDVLLRILRERQREQEAEEAAQSQERQHSR